MKVFVPVWIPAFAGMTSRGVSDFAYSAFMLHSEAYAST